MVMEEMMVALICINGKGCDESYNTYAYYKPSITEMIKQNETRARNIVPAFVFEYVAPMAASAAGVDISVKLNRNFSIKGTKTTTQLTFKREF